MLALTLGGCSNGHPGRFLVVVSSDIPAPDQLAAVRVSAGLEPYDFPLAETRLPFSLAVDATPGRAEGEPVKIVVSSLDPSGTTLVTRPVTTTFRTNRTLVLPVELLRRCTPLAQCGAQLRCNATEACTSDGCVSPTLDSADLREVTTPGDELGTSTTAEQVCTAYADLLCSAVLRCCPSLSGARRSSSATDRSAWPTRSPRASRPPCRSSRIPVLASIPHEPPRPSRPARRSRASAAWGSRSGARPRSAAACLRSRARSPLVVRARSKTEAASSRVATLRVCLPQARSIPCASRAPVQDRPASITAASSSLRSSPMPAAPTGSSVPRARRARRVRRSSPMTRRARAARSASRAFASDRSARVAMAGTASTAASAP
jgi:hypothetical protein